MVSRITNVCMTKQNVTMRSQVDRSCALPKKRNYFCQLGFLRMKLEILLKVFHLVQES